MSAEMAFRLIEQALLDPDWDRARRAVRDICLKYREGR